MRASWSWRIVERFKLHLWGRFWLERTLRELWAIFSIAWALRSFKPLMLMVTDSSAKRRVGPFFGWFWSWAPSWAHPERDCLYAVLVSRHRRFLKKDGQRPQRPDRLPRVPHSMPGIQAPVGSRARSRWFHHREVMAVLPPLPEHSLRRSQMRCAGRQLEQSVRETMEFGLAFRTWTAALSSARMPAMTRSLRPTNQLRKHQCQWERCLPMTHCCLSPAMEADKVEMPRGRRLCVC